MSSTESRIRTAVLLVAEPTVQLGGPAPLGTLTGPDPGLPQNSLGQGVCRAAHEHGGACRSPGGGGPAPRGTGPAVDGAPSAGASGLPVA